MPHAIRARWGRLALMTVAVLALAGVIAGSATLAAQGEPPADPQTEPPGRVEHVDGTNVDRVVLTAAAAARLAIATQPVREAQIAGVTRRVIPYAAVLYDANGDAWTYTNPEPLVFVRQRITVVSIQGDQAVLADGPAPGTPVVTVGAPELYGTEFGVSGDE
jgi:hypothetical protein